MKRLLLFLLFFVSITLSAEVTIIMEKDGGVYKIPCLVNGAKMKFIFDTGAATVCLSESMAEYLLDNNYISKEDIVGVGTSIVADGSEVEHLKIILKDIEIGGLHLNDVEASIIEGQRAPLLLGQSAIQKLGKISIEGNLLVIDNGFSEECCPNGLDGLTFDYIKKAAESKKYFTGFYERILANCYYYGDCTNKDLNKAAYWYEISAKLGDIHGMTGWADCLYFGRGTQKNMSASIYWFQKAADKEDPYALYSLGFCYGHGIGVNKDIDTGFDYTKRAANKDWNDAQTELAYYFDIFINDAKSGYVNAYFYVGLCFYYGYGTNQDFSKALYWYKQGAENGDRDCQNNIATMYQEGKGCKKDMISAIFWYKKAANQGHVHAQRNLGYVYKNGEGVSVDFPTAFYWFSRAAEQEDVKAIYEIGWMYYSGNGLDSDYHKAYEYFLRASKQEFNSAYYALGVMHWNGYGVEKDYAKAVDWWYRCREYGPAYHNIAIAWRDGKGREKKLDMYRKFILYCQDKVPYPDGMNEIAYNFALGRYGWSVQLDKAHEVINDAIELEPNDPNYYDSKGEFYSLQGKYVEAKEMWLKVKSIDPSYYKENNTELHKYILKHNK